MSAEEVPRTETVEAEDTFACSSANAGPGAGRCVDGQLFDQAYTCACNADFEFAA